VDLRSLLLRRTVPRVFVVTAVGARDARLATERLLRLRGWASALSPAEANVLVLCAPQGHVLDDVVDRLWEQMPSPRARVQIVSAHAVQARLDEAAGTLRNPEHQRHDASMRTGPTMPHEEGHGDHSGHRVVEDSGHDAHRGGGHDMSGHAGHDMGDHAGHDMGGMEVAGGIRMAGRGEDRDGLKLDRLHVWLGPALPDWPAGLAVRLTLQGDVVQDAEVVLHTGTHGVPSRGGPQERLDSVQRLLSVAGWPAAAMVARRLRDDLVDGLPVSPLFQKWSRRVRRSRLLRWSTDGLGLLGADAPEALRGDATARWMRWLNEADPSIASTATHTPDPTIAQAAVDALPVLLMGHELAAARLIVASLDPDVDALATTRAPEHAHGH
jgi:hypothetical protein